MDVSTFITHRRSLDTPAGKIAYTEWGSGPVALFVHGLGTSGLLWRHVIENLHDTSRCIAIDLPMHGGTPARDDMSVTAIAQVVADLCEGLGLTQVDLVGNDTGGAVAQIFAARHPDRIRTFTLTNCDCEGNFRRRSSSPLSRPRGRERWLRRLRQSSPTPRPGRQTRWASATSTPNRFPRRYGATTSPRSAGPWSAPGTSSG